ncbi:PspA/IM30 family protein [Bacillaceae bacterium]
MSVMKRIRDLSVATFHELLEQAEDPVRLVDRFLLSTRREIIAAEKLHRRFLSHAKEMKRQIEHAQAMKEKRERQALLALKAKEEDVARLALQEKIWYEEKIEQYTALYEQSRQAAKELEAQIHLLKTEFQSVYEKRQYYAARMEGIRLQQRLQQRIAFCGSHNVPRMFEKLEDRISDWELEAQSLRELRRMGREMAVQPGSTSPWMLEQELNRLKQKLQENGKE